MKNTPVVDFGRSFWSDDGDVTVYFEHAQIMYLKPETRAFLQTHALCGDCRKPLGTNSLCGGGGTHSSLWFAKEHRELLEPIIVADQIRAKNRRGVERRADDLKWVGGFHLKQDLETLYDAQGGRCYFCGADETRKNLRRDHLTPICRDGSTDWPSNIALVCAVCNSRKSDRREAQFWRLLTEECGSDWVRGRKEQVIGSRALARHLTIQRKRELHQYCRSLQAELNRLCVEWRNNNRLEADEHERVSVDYDSSGVLLRYIDAELQLPPFTHRKISQRDWIGKQAPTIMTCLIGLERSLGNVRWEQSPHTKIPESNQPAMAEDNMRNVMPD